MNAETISTQGTSTKHVAYVAKEDTWGITCDERLLLLLLGAIACAGLLAPAVL